MSVARFVFQASAIDHSAISPFRINHLRAVETANCVRPPNVPRSLTGRFQYHGLGGRGLKTRIGYRSSPTAGGRMRVDVLHAVGRLAGQARCVEVVDVRDVRIEDVERLQHEASLVRQPIADLAIPNRRALRVDAPILDEGARPNDELEGFPNTDLRGSTVTPAEITRSRAPGTSVPAGSLLVNRACVNARSASTVTHGARRA